MRKMMKNDSIKKPTCSNDLVHADETVDDLGRDGLYLIQKKDGFRFGTDAVLLSDFAAETGGKALLDMCTGTGIIPILLSAKSNVKHISAIEIQSQFSEMAERSVKLNNLTERIDIFNGDLKNAPEIFGVNSFEHITCNPPYLEAGANIQNDYDSLTIARHEVKCTLEDIIRTSAKLLKYKGHLYLIHKSERLEEIILLFNKYGIRAKRLRMVHPRVDKNPSMVLIDGVYQGGKQLSVLPPLILQDEQGRETDEVKRIYNRENI